jgi:hypothetical protein
VTTFVRRARAGEPMAKLNRDHAHQRLVQQHWPHLLSSGWSALVAAAGCLGVALLADRAPVVVLLLLVGLVVLYVDSPDLLVSTPRTEEGTA